MGVMKYDKEFKKEAIRKYLAGQSIASISRETGVWWSRKAGQKTLSC